MSVAPAAALVQGILASITHHAANLWTQVWGQINLKLIPSCLTNGISANMMRNMAKVGGGCDGVQPATCSKLEKRGKNHGD